MAAMVEPEAAVARAKEHRDGLPTRRYQSRLATSKWLAWAYLGCILASFTLLSELLAAWVPPDQELYRQLDEEVPARLFHWQLAAFGGVMVINILNILFCTSQVQHNCNVLLIAIHGVAFMTDLSLARRTTPLVRGPCRLDWNSIGLGGLSFGGAPSGAAQCAPETAAGLFFPLRYVQWLHSTPTMLLLMALMSDLSSAQLGATVAADVAMILAGLAASWLAGPMQIAAGTLSFAAFVPVMWSMTAMMQDAINEARGPHAQFMLRLMLGTTLAVWALFPLIWALAHLGVLAPVTEHLMWGVADYAAKVVFSSHLWQKNFVTIEQRKADAQLALDEANRSLILERLRQLLGVKDRLVHSLTHELRTPINGIMALTNELLHNSAQSAAGRHKMLAMIRSSAGCLLNIINATLDNAAASSGTLRLSNYKVHLWRVTECVVRLTRPLLKDNVQLHNCVDRDFPAVKTDSTRLMQVLFNLVGNASRFTHVGSVRISASLAPGMALVSVTDTGVGIAPERLPHIFKPFDQVSQSTGGSGLGLYLVKQCLDAMGCTITATSEVGQGSTFTFQLPLADEDAESEESADVDVLRAAVATASASARSSLESPGLGDAAGRGRRGSLDLGRLAAALKRRLSNSARASMEVDVGVHPPLLEGRATFYPEAAAPGAGAGAGSSSAATGPGSSCDSAGAPAAAGAAAARLQQQQQQPVGPFPRAQPAAQPSAAAQQLPGTCEWSDLGTSPTEESLASAGADVGQGGGLPPSPAPQKLNHRTKHGSIQVLSVDDDAINQMVAATVLKSHKWGVIKCMNGMEALDHLSRCPVLPDLVLLDVMMPRMSGYDVARRIREMYPSNTLPIIMVSAKAEEEDVVEGLKCGADDYVTKPFKRAELAARIRAHIRARDAFAEQQAADEQWIMQHNLLPRNVQRKLRNGETVVAEHHAAATVLWAEVVGLPRLAAGVPPLDLVVMLNSLYTTWDELCEDEGALGVDFSGSTYVAVSGHDDNPEHMELILRVAESMLSVAAATRYPDGSAVKIRLGVHSGPINTGLVGSKAVKFTLMGETVDVARQLAATGCPMAVHVSEAAQQKLSPDAAAKSTLWTVQRLGQGSAGSSSQLPALAGGAAAAGAGAGAAAAAAAAGGSGRLPVRPQQTFLLPSRYTSPDAGGGGAGAGEGPRVSMAIQTPDTSDRAGPSGAGGGAAAAATGRGPGWAGMGSGRRSRAASGVVQEVPWLQLQDLTAEHALSGPPSSVAGAASSDVTTLAAELAAVRTTQLEAQLCALTRQAEAAAARERELQERLLALTAEHAKATTELSLARAQALEAREAAAAERRRGDALQSQLDGGGAVVRQQLGDVWRTMAGMKQEMQALVAQEAQQQLLQHQQQAAWAASRGSSAEPLPLVQVSSMDQRQHSASSARGFVARQQLPPHHQQQQQQPADAARQPAGRSASVDGGSQYDGGQQDRSARSGGGGGGGGSSGSGSGSLNGSGLRQSLGGMLKMLSTSGRRSSDAGPSGAGAAGGQQQADGHSQAATNGGPEGAP